MATRTDTIFHPTTDSFGTLTVRTRAVSVRRVSPAVVAAGFLLSLALALTTLYQADRMVFAQPHVAHSEIFAVDLD